MRETMHRLRNRLASAILKTPLEREWAVAEYDGQGNVIHVSYRDYDVAPVMRSLQNAERDMQRLRDRGEQVEGGVTLVSRTFTDWKRA